MTSQPTTIAIHGLGKMGMQIARKLAADGHTVIAHNRSAGPREVAATYGAINAPDKQAVLSAFKDQPVIIWLMLPDSITGEELTAWLEVVPKGSTLIDGGNSDYRLTRQHAEQAEAVGMKFIDTGTSGGIMGFEQGFCMMSGGDQTAYDRLFPIYDTLAAPHGGHAFFGPAGAGHYVKMVHNAIEYGMMQSMAEGYQLLREGPYAGIDLAAAGQLWQQGSIVQSLLNKLTADVLAANPTLHGTEGYVHESGEARWALETARDRGIPTPAIQAAMDVRLRSQQGDISFATQLLAEMRHAFGGHALNKESK